MKLRVLVASLFIALSHVSETRGDEIELCTACTLSSRALRDFLCDVEFQGWLVMNFDQSVCKGFEDDKKREDCYQLSAALLPMLVEYARPYINPAAICADVCKNSTSMGSLVSSQPVIQSSECGLCRYVVRSAKQESPEGTPMQEQQAFTALASKACTSLPVDMQPSCQDFIGRQGALLATFSGLDNVCEVTGPCTSEALHGMIAYDTDSSSRLENMVRTFGSGFKAAAAQLVSTAGYNHHGGKRLGWGYATPSPHLADTSPCDQCKLYVLQARMFFRSTTVQYELGNATMALCGHFEPYAQECKDDVEKYAPFFFEEMLKYGTPDTVCSGLHVCPPAITTREGRGHWHEGTFGRLSGLFHTLVHELFGHQE